MSRHHGFALAALLLATATAGASPDAPMLAEPDTAAAPLIATTKAQRPQLAVGVNLPLMWGSSMALSASVGFAKHHAIRVNLARYANTGEIGILIGDVFFDGDGSDAIAHGRNVDASVGYVIFPRKLWDGGFLEAAALVRDTDSHVEDESASPEVVITETKMVGASGIVGWSWLMYGHAFIQIGVGISMGHEFGKQTTSRSAYDYMPETHQVSRSTASGEGFIRFGGAFDL